MKKKAHFPQAVNKLLVLKQEVGNSKSVFAQNICDSDNDQLNERQGWNGIGNDGYGTIGFNLLLSTRMTRMARKVLCSLAKFRSQAITMPMQATRGVNSMPHRAHLSRATHVFFLCARGSRIVGLQFLRVLKVIIQCFTAPCLTLSCLRTSLHRFLYFCPLPLRKGCYASADWLNNPLPHMRPWRCD